jgi:hypothetical protein
VLQGAAVREPVGEDDPELQRRVGDYLAAQNEILQRFPGATNAVARNKASTTSSPTPTATVT